MVVGLYPRFEISIVTLSRHLERTAASFSLVGGTQLIV